MAGFFSVRLAPGVRVSASSRGLRAHVGPRGARLHVGGGRSGVSTGTGPFTFYQSVDGGRGRRAASRPHHTGPSAAEIARADKAQRAALIGEALVAIGDLHRHEFADATRPEADLPASPAAGSLLPDARRAERAGIRWWRLTERAAAARRARADAAREAARLREEARAQQRAAQERLDERWQALLANDPAVVLSGLADAFEDNEAPVAAVGVAGAEVSLVVLVPGPEVLPDHYPTTTEAGNLSLRRTTHSLAAGWYRQLVAGHVVVSAKEAFAVCPALDSARIVALRDEGPDVHGSPRARPVLATRLSRAGLADVRWEAATSWDVVEQTGTETVVKERGTARELQPLDLEHEPDLARLAAAVNLDELAAEVPSGGQAPAPSG